eukprot:gb/GECG01014730.1/.p1 GENE.gb/GECG01014730.1/~~gb/GECG01014730.1/.p1  ORF type:complete len:199 (+),score=18.73 gb/GECG01014730.1/:1-597(+)
MSRQETPLPPPRPEDKDKWTLVLDINETLAHAEDAGGFTEVKPDVSLLDGQLQVVFRPHVNEFLREVSKKFEIVLWGSGHPIYVNGVADGLDKSRDYIRWRVSGFSCGDSPYGKDLRKLGRNLKRTIIIDNNPGYMAGQPENGIVCNEFYASPRELREDRELLIFRDFLTSIPADTQDLRPVVQTWKRENRRGPTVSS